MATDARVSTGLPAHPKTKKLIRRVGEAGAWHLICLVLWARSNRPDGDLSGMSGEDIELAVDWRGEPDAFVHALAEVGFLDGAAGNYSLHDWAEHQPWSTGSEARSERAKWTALCRHHGKAEATRQMPEYASRIFASSIESDASSKKSDASSKQGASVRDASSKKTDAPSPSPSPSPSPRALELTPPGGGVVAGKPAPPACPHSDIVALYHEILPELTRVRDWGEDRQALLRSRWREDPRRQSLGWWRKFFEYVHGCPFLMGQEASGDRAPFFADLEWLIRPKNFRKVIEGKYQQRRAA